MSFYSRESAEQFVGTLYLLLTQVGVDQGMQALGFIFAPPAVQLGITQLQLSPPVSAPLRQPVQATANLSPLGALFPHHLPQLLIFFFAPLALQHPRNS